MRNATIMLSLFFFTQSWAGTIVESFEVRDNEGPRSRCEAAVTKAMASYPSLSCEGKLTLTERAALPIVFLHDTYRCDVTCGSMNTGSSSGKDGWEWNSDGDGCILWSRGNKILSSLYPKIKPEEADTACENCGGCVWEWNSDGTACYLWSPKKSTVPNAKGEIIKALHLELHPELYEAAVARCGK